MSASKLGNALVVELMCLGGGLWHAWVVAVRIAMMRTHGHTQSIGVLVLPWLFP